MKEIFSYNEIAQKEGFQMQKGMNFRPQKKNYSIFLMSVREDAPYQDGFDKEGKKLYYEGEDISKREKDEPKKFDQPLLTKSGKLTNNGLFFQCAEEFKYGRRRKPEKLKVYEKIDNNVWSDKGWFHLVDVEFTWSPQEDRKVFKFILIPEDIKIKSKEEMEEFEFSRRIPTEVKKFVWERDEGKCIECGADENLHFDHIIPWSKGGSSIDPKNIQLLCGKHNLKKSDKIR